RLQPGDQGARRLQEHARDLRLLRHGASDGKRAPVLEALMRTSTNRDDADAGPWPRSPTDPGPSCRGLAALRTRHSSPKAQSGRGRRARPAALVDLAREDQRCALLVRSRARGLRRRLPKTTTIGFISSPTPTSMRTEPTARTAGQLPTGRMIPGP